MNQPRSKVHNLQINQGEKNENIVIECKMFAIKQYVAAETKYTGSDCVITSIETTKF